MAEGSSSGSREVPNISKNYKKLTKSFNRSFSEFKNRVMDAIDNMAIELFAKNTNCKLCSQFLVLTARNACCSKCFIAWMTEYKIENGSIIKCRVCARPINTVLDPSYLPIFCEIVELGEEKRAGVIRHFGYPLLNSREMDLLFEDFESDAVSNITE